MSSQAVCSLFRWIFQDLILIIHTLDPSTPCCEVWEKRHCGDSRMQWSKCQCERCMHSLFHFSLSSFVSLSFVVFLFIKRNSLTIPSRMMCDTFSISLECSNIILFCFPISLGFFQCHRERYSLYFLSKMKKRNRNLIWKNSLSFLLKTSLHFVARFGFPEIALFLLQNGAAVNLQTVWLLPFFKERFFSEFSSSSLTENCAAFLTLSYLESLELSSLYFLLFLLFLLNVFTFILRGFVLSSH